MRHLAILFMLCVLLVFGVHPGFGAPVAQDAPVESPTLPLVDVNGAGDQLIGVVNGIVTGGVNAAWFAPIVALVVGLLKSVPALYKSSPDDPSGVPAPTLSFVVSAVVWCIAAVVTRTGVEAQFNSFMDLVVQSAPYLFGFLATLGIAPAVHEYAASVKAPILGSKRSPELAVVEAIPAASLSALQPVAQPIDEAAIRRLVEERVSAALAKSGFDWTPTESRTALG